MYQALPLGRKSQVCRSRTLMSLAVCSIPRQRESQNDEIFNQINRITRQNSLDCFMYFEESIKKNEVRNDRGNLLISKLTVAPGPRIEKKKNEITTSWDKKEHIASVKSLLTSFTRFAFAWRRVQVEKQRERAHSSFEMRVYEFNN